MFGSNLNYESEVFVDGYNLTGVSSVSINARQSSSVISPVGTTRGCTLVSGPPTQTMSLSRSLIYKDPILEYVGVKDKPLKAGILNLEDQTFYGFESGYIKDYTVNCAVGTAPKVSVNLNVLDEVKSIPALSSDKRVHEIVEVPTQGSISVSSEDFETNRVIGFDYSVSIDQKLIYTVGSTNPTSTILLNTKNYAATVQIELEKSFGGGSFDFLRSRGKSEIELTIRGRRDRLIESLSIPNASLISTSVTQSAEGVSKLTLGYIGHDGDGGEYLP